ncbi:unnamed protein product [Pleuronectes platessa]|uniref:Uncharacterized protein n=1 Tax=Pleuronectes platessa TaxID=8262 RepID=A0A9N7YJV5_PLEPL|nr:unnamed protein product [Pleuronectes platessa]
MLRVLCGVRLGALTGTKMLPSLNRRVLGKHNKRRHKHHRFNTATSHGVSMQRLTAPHEAQTGGQAGGTEEPLFWAREEANAHPVKVLSPEERTTVAKRLR